MKTLTVNMQQTAPLLYHDVVEWKWTDNYIHIALEDETVVNLNANYVVAVIWKEDLEPEQAQLWDVDDDG